jgi:diguanylate cyclase (GGDEF)-like protein
MDELQDLIERMKHNEEVEQKFFQIETRILSVLDFKDLFETLLAEIRDKFEIPYVWITLVDDSDIAHLIQAATSSELLKQRLSVLDRKTFTRILGPGSQVLLANEDLSPFYRIFPENEAYLIRSVALVPISLEGRVIGSLNHADSSAVRYKPGMDTSLLERLGVKLSICLSNVMAHERMRLAGTWDALTGLLNSGALSWALRNEFSRAFRYGIPLSLLVAEADDLEGVHSRYGRVGRDACLKHVAEHLKRISRESDVIARTEEDTFVVILPFTNGAQAAKIGNRLVSHLAENPLYVDGGPVPLSLSFAIAGLGESGAKDPEMLLGLARDGLPSTKNPRKGARVVPLNGTRSGVENH